MIKVIKWEYLAVSDYSMSQSVEEYLDHYGSLGWELVQLEYEKQDRQQKTIGRSMIFKRRIHKDNVLYTAEYKNRSTREACTCE